MGCWLAKKKQTKKIKHLLVFSFYLCTSTLILEFVQERFFCSVFFSPFFFL